MIPVDDKTRVPYEREKGNVFIEVPIICEGSTDDDKIYFVYDTGAYITVINRERYEWFGLDKLPRYEGTIGSYSGSSDGYVFQIPGLIIGQRLLAGVWAFTPKSNDEKQNLLGDNVIEYFRPFQDNLNDCFYFIDNPSPNPYVSPDNGFSLACDSIMLVEEVNVVNDTLNRAGELLQLQNYFRKREQKAAEKAAKQAATTSMEKMIITALQGNTPSEVIEAMRKNAGITVARLDELKKQAQNIC